nr:hypothetical protein [Roseomonas sp. HF4]
MSATHSRFRRRRREDAADQIIGWPLRRLAPRRGRDPTPRHAAQPGLAHRPCDALAGSRRAFGLQLGTHLRGAGGAMGASMDRPDPAQQDAIDLRMSRGRDP